MELKDQLSALQAELKTYVEKSADEVKANGTMLTETKSVVDKLQTQLDAIDLKMAEKYSGPSEKDLVDQLKENENVARMVKDGRGSASITLKSSDLERKTTITSTAVGAATSGVLQIDRTPGIVREAQQRLTVRNALSARPTSMQVIDFVKVNAPLAPGAMTVEASALTENAVTFITASEKIRNLGTFLPASRQIMDDFSELAGFLQSDIPYKVDVTEELQLLSGDNTGENLHGLIPQASAFAGVYDANANMIDYIGEAIAQVASAKELDPTFIFVNTADWWKIRLTKDNYGRYLLGDPQTVVTPSLFGVQVIPTTNMTAGHFLVGNGTSTAAEIRDRMETVIEISTEHADFFQKNLVAIRALKRLALVVKRPGAFVAGAYPTAA